MTHALEPRRNGLYDPKLDLNLTGNAVNLSPQNTIGTVFRSAELPNVVIAAKDLDGGIAFDLHGCAVDDHREHSRFWLWVVLHGVPVPFATQVQRFSVSTCGKQQEYCEL